MVIPFVFLFFYVCAHTHAHVHMPQQGVEVREQLMGVNESRFFFRHMDPGSWPKVIRLVGKCLYLLSHLDCHISNFFKWVVNRLHFIYKCICETELNYLLFGGGLSSRSMPYYLWIAFYYIESNCFFDLVWIPSFLWPQSKKQKRLSHIRIKTGALELYVGVHWGPSATSGLPCALGKSLHHIELFPLKVFVKVKLVSICKMLSEHLLVNSDLS